MNVVSRHMHILRAQIVAVAAALAISVAGMSFLANSQNQNFDQETTRQAQVTERNDFYQVIAGTEGADSNNASDKLAVDLHQTFEPVVRREATFETVVSEFSASSQEYRGITEDIGFNPFDAVGLSCEECGQLNSTMRSNLEQIFVQDNLASLIEEVQVVENTVSVTPFGWSVWFTLLVVWQIAGSIGLLYGLARYGGRKLTWKRDGQNDGIELVTVLVSPLGFAVFHFFYNKPALKRLQNRDNEILEASGLSTELEQIERQIGILRELSAGSAETREVVDTIAELEAQRAEILAYPSSLSERDVARTLSGALRGADGLLERSRSVLDSHNEAVDELNALDVTHDNY